MHMWCAVFLQARTHDAPALPPPLSFLAPPLSFLPSPLQMYPPTHTHIPPRSTVHRVHNRSDAATRHSLVFFCNTDFDAVVETMPSCLPPGVGAAAAEGGGGGSEAAAAVAGGTGSEAAAAGTDGGGSVAAAAGGGVIGRRHPPIKAGDYILQKLGLMFN